MAAGYGSRNRSILSHTLKQELFATLVDDLVNHPGWQSIYQTAAEIAARLGVIFRQIMNYDCQSKTVAKGI